MSKSQYTFWELINEFNIQIPIIQRDYAQGRNVDSINEIRSSFLGNIYDVLLENKGLDLDFVYGTINEGKFVPLDGQQRLTTLFLLHWYLALKEGEIGQVKDVLCKFTYETRSTSRDFCNELVNSKEVFRNVNIEIRETLSEVIVDSYWFHTSWLMDPTIKSMLTMLDSIHKRFKNTDGFLHKLIYDGLINFKFICLEDFGLEDSLYIKMNARGKALTPFENFKAKLEQYIRDGEKNRSFEGGFSNRFTVKMDGAWTDLFWNYREEETNTFDDRIMNFIRAIIINEYAIRGIDEEEKSVLDEMINYEGHLSFNRLSTLGVIDRNIILKLEEIFDVFCNGVEPIKTYLDNSNIIDERKLFNTLINGGMDNNISYTDRVQFYALTEYLTRYSNFDSKKFKEWMRVVRNLTENTIDNNIGEFIKSITAIDNIIAYANDILVMLDREKRIDRFWSGQVLEERIKARLLLRGDKWREVIEVAENHGYFKGQIDFLLSFSKLDSNNFYTWSIDDEEKALSTFKEYYNKANCVFGDNGLRIDGSLWRRALLCTGDYLLTKSRNLSFLIDNNDRDISFKRLLRDSGEKREYVKALLDKITVNNILGDLRAVIDGCSVNDWRRYFIKFEKMIEECGTSGFIRRENEDKILLLKKTTTIGYNKEYYSYALYLSILESNNSNVNYIEDKGVDSEKYVELLGRDVNVKYVSGNGFSIVDSGSVHCLRTLDEVLVYLRRKNYIR